MNGKARAEKAEVNTNGYTEQEKFDAFARWAGGLEAFCQPSDADKPAVSNRTGLRDSEDHQEK